MIFANKDIMIFKKMEKKNIYIYIYYIFEIIFWIFRLISDILLRYDNFK